MRAYLILFLLACGVIFCRCSDRSKVSESETASESWSFSEFEKADAMNPILEPAPHLKFECPISERVLAWEQRNVLNPAAVVKDGEIHLFYRAQDRLGTSRIGLATSTDGFNFTQRPEPVFYPDNDSMRPYEWSYLKSSGPIDPEGTYFDGVEDPRIVESDAGVYIMTYTAYDGKTARLCLASSDDLVNWTKHGLVLADEKYRDYWSKSGAIVVERRGERNIAKRINGKYWMYFGDTDIFMATSEDLIHWEPCENSESGQLIRALKPRPGYFDSRLVEPGPFALYTEHGILLIYNGSNASNFNDVDLPMYTYAAGQALFDSTRPYKLVDRTEGYFIHPDKDYEKVGEVNEVCFVEGLVYFKEAWYLYYGTADTRIAVATSNESID